MKVNMHEAKSQLSRLGRLAWEGEEVVIAKGRRALAAPRALSRAESQAQAGGVEGAGSDRSGLRRDPAGSHRFVPRLEPVPRRGRVVARLLLDTHVVLWALAEPARLTRPARTALEEAENEVFVSVVSGWEIAIKRALGKLEAPDDLEAAITMQGFEPLLVTFHHATQAGRPSAASPRPVRPDADRPGAGRGARPRHPGSGRSTLRRPHPGRVKAAAPDQSDMDSVHYRNR